MLCLLLLIACNVEPKDFHPLPEEALCGTMLSRVIGQLAGKVVMLDFNTQESKRLKHLEGVNYRDLTLAYNSKDIFATNNPNNACSKIIRTTSEKTTLNTVYELCGYHISNLSISRDDRYLVFDAYDLSSKNAYPESARATLFIFDLYKKKILYKYSNIALNTNLRIGDNAWNGSSTKFLISFFSMVTDVNGIYEKGLYEFDLDAKELILIDSNIVFGSYNASGDIIASERANSVFIFNTKTKSMDKIFELSSRYNINEISWSPCNANELLIIYYDKYRRRSYQLIMDISTKQKYKLDEYYFVEKSFTWRNL